MLLKSPSLPRVPPSVREDLDGIDGIDGLLGSLSRQLFPLLLPEEALAFDGGAASPSSSFFRVTLSLTESIDRFMPLIVGRRGIPVH
jgi:hypothetical protein